MAARTFDLRGVHAARVAGRRCWCSCWACSSWRLTRTRRPRCSRRRPPRARICWLPIAPSSCSARSACVSCSPRPSWRPAVAASAFAVGARARHPRPAVAPGPRPGAHRARQGAGGADLQLAAAGGRRAVLRASLVVRRRAARPGDRAAHHSVHGDAVLLLRSACSSAPLMPRPIAGLALRAGGRAVPAVRHARAGHGLLAAGRQRLAQAAAVAEPVPRAAVGRRQRHRRVRPRRAGGVSRVVLALPGRRTGRRACSCPRG